MSGWVLFSNVSGLNFKGRLIIYFDKDKRKRMCRMIFIVGYSFIVTIDCSFCEPDEVLVERVRLRNVCSTQCLQDADPEVCPSLHGLLVSLFLLFYFL